MFCCIVSQFVVQYSSSLALSSLSGSCRAVLVVSGYIDSSLRDYRSVPCLWVVRSSVLIRLLVASQTPYPDSGVPRGRGDSKPCWSNCYLGDPVVVAREVANMSTRHIPHVDGSVVTGCKEQPA